MSPSSNSTWRMRPLPAAKARSVTTRPFRRDLDEPLACQLRERHRGAARQPMAEGNGPAGGPRASTCRPAGPPAGPCGGRPTIAGGRGGLRARRPLGPRCPAVRARRARPDARHRTHQAAAPGRNPLPRWSCMIPSRTVPRRPPRDLVGDVARRLRGGERGECLGQHLGARLGQLDPARGAPQQGDAELRLEIADRRGDPPTARNVEPLGGAREAALLRDGDGERPRDDRSSTFTAGILSHSAIDRSTNQRCWRCISAPGGPMPRTLLPAHHADRRCHGRRLLGVHLSRSPAIMSQSTSSQPAVRDLHRPRRSLALHDHARLRGVRRRRGRQPRFSPDISRLHGRRRVPCCPRWRRRSSARRPPPPRARTSAQALFLGRILNGIAIGAVRRPRPRPPRRAARDTAPALSAARRTAGRHDGQPRRHPNRPADPTAPWRSGSARRSSFPTPSPRRAVVAGLVAVALSPEDEGAYIAAAALPRPARGGATRRARPLLRGGTRRLPRLLDARLSLPVWRARSSPAPCTRPRTCLPAPRSSQRSLRVSSPRSAPADGAWAHTLHSRGDGADLPPAWPPSSSLGLARDTEPGAVSRRFGAVAGRWRGRAGGKAIQGHAHHRRGDCHRRRPSRGGLAGLFLARYVGLSIPVIGEIGLALQVTELPRMPCSVSLCSSVLAIAAAAPTLLGHAHHGRDRAEALRVAAAVLPLTVRALSGAGRRATRPARRRGDGAQRILISSKTVLAFLVPERMCGALADHAGSTDWA